MLLSLTLSIVAFALAPESVAQNTGPRKPPIEALKAFSRGVSARTIEGEVSPSGPSTWRGFDRLDTRTRQNLIQSSGSSLLSSPAYTPNVQANDPTGDLTTEGQYYASVAAWNRFVVVVWIDTKGSDGPVNAPVSTFVGYAYSCDWGATFADGGSIPRAAANEQVYDPWVTRSESGTFYLAANYQTGLDGSGNPTQRGIALWTAVLDTNACTFSWGAPQAIAPLTSSAGDDFDAPSIAVDPANGRIWISACYQPGSVGNWRIVATASDDGGTTWKPIQYLSNPAAPVPSWWPYTSDLAIGPNGEALVIWGDTAYSYWCDLSNFGISHFQIARSTDGGYTWSSPTVVAPYFSPFFSDGPTNYWGYHRPIPRLAVDRSSGPNRGRVYAAWASSGYWSAPGPGTGTTVVEAEPNGTPAQAVSMVPGDNATGAGASNTDIDWWRISLNAGDVLLARLEPADFNCGISGSSYSFRFQLYTDQLDPGNGATLDTLLAGSGAFTDFSQVVFTCRVTGTYYLRARLLNVGPANIGYTIRTRLMSWGYDAGSGRDESDVLFASSPNGILPWTSPFRISGEVPAGYHESNPDVAVDATGRVRVVWHDHRETDVEPRLTHQGQLTDLLMRTSIDGGVSFEPSERVSDISSIFGADLRTNFIYLLHGNELAVDGDHLMIGWSDQRYPTRALTGVNVLTQFVDKEPPTVALTSGPTGMPAWWTTAPTYAWSATDRRNGATGNQYRWDLFSMPGHILHSTSVYSTNASNTFSVTPGYYQLEVHAKDSSDNESAALTQSFVLDQTAPTVTIDSGPGNGSWVASSSVTFTWSGSDEWSSQFPESYPVFSYEIDGAISPYPAPGTGSGPTSVDLTGLTTGSHTFSVRARDLAGNESAPVTRTFSVDTQAPETQIVGGPADGGTASTNPVTFTFTGTDDQTPTGQLEFATSVDGGAFGGFSTATSASPSFSDGSHSFAVKARDLAGNEDATPETRTFTVHAQVPEVTITSSFPAPGFTGSSFTFTWSSTISPLSSSVTYATSLDGGPFSGEGSETSLVLTGLAEGSHTLVIRATDDAALQGTATATWTVDATPPSAVITSPSENQHIASSSVTFTWTGNDGSGSGNVQYSHRVDQGPWSALGSGTSTEITGLAEGSHLFELRAQDAVGNEVAAGSCPFDATDLVSWWAGDGNANDSWGGNHGTPSGSVTYTPGIRNLAYTFDGTSFVTVPGSPSLLPLTGSFSIEAWVLIADVGLPQAIVERRDLQGTRSRYELGYDGLGSALFRVKASHLTAGTGQVLFSSGFVYIADGAWHHLVGVRDMSTSQLLLYVDGVLDAAEPLTVQSSGSIRDTLTVNPLHIGGVAEPLWGQVDEVVYTSRALSAAQIAAIYASGGRAPCSAAGAGRNFTVDLTAPSTTITLGPADGSTVSTNPVTFDFVGTDNLTPASSLLFATSWDGGAYGTFSTATSDSRSLPDGSHTFAVKARDLAGNEDATPDFRSFTVHAQLPTVAFVSGPSEGGYSGGSPTFTWSSTISPLSTSVTYDILLDNVPYAQGQTDPSITIAGGLMEGTHTLEVRATDNVGLVGTATRTWTVDTTPPTVTITAGPAAGSFISSDNATFQWTTSDGGGGGVETSYRLDNGPWTTYAATLSANLVALAEGSHQFDVRARDAVGNETQQTCTFDTNGLVSWWSGEGNASDAWGTNHGTLQNGVGFAAGKVRTGFQFDGVDDFVRVPHDPGLDPGVGSFSLEAWVKTSASVLAAVVVNKQEVGGVLPPGGTNSSSYQVDVEGGIVRFYVRDTDGGGPDNGGQYVDGTAVNDGQWHHIVATRDQASGTLNLYQDGALTTSAPTNPGSSGALTDDDGEADPMTIGAGLDVGSIVPAYFFEGQIDEVLYVDRALSGAEIAAIHTAGGRAPCTGTASRTFTVDLTAPETQITMGPSDGSTQTSSSVTFEYSGADDFSATGALEYSFTAPGEGPSPFSTSTTMSRGGLVDGVHSFSVVARDQAGNIDPTPATRTWTVHAVAPTVAIVGPERGFSGTSATLSWSSVLSPVATGVTYETNLDGAGFVSQGTTTSLTESNLAPGTHTLEVQATDNAGLQGSATVTWFVDQTSPTVAITSGPDQDAFVNTQIATLTWSASDLETGVLESSWRLDNGIWTITPATPQPGGLLLLAETFTYPDGPLGPTSEGAWVSHSGAGPDLQVTAGRVAGDMNVDPDDNRTFAAQSATAKTYYGLHVRIASMAGTPATNYFAHLKDTGTFNFRGRLYVTPGTTTFRFGISNNNTLGATWPSDLAYDRDYRVVVSYDAATGVTELWVDPTTELSPKVTAIDPAPFGIPVSSFALRQSTTLGGVPVTGTLWQYSVDNIAVGTTFETARTSSPQHFSTLLPGLSPGMHTFEAKATDVAGNESAPVVRSWRVDIEAPETQITAGVADSGTITTNSAAFSFSATDDQASAAQITYATSEDGANYTQFSSTTDATMSGLGEGVHTFAVKAMDAAGNEDATPETRTFTVHTTPPTVTLLTGPPENGYTAGSATFTWSSTLSTAANSVTYATSLDGGPFSSEDAEASVTLSNLAEGSHTLVVRATDNAGLQGTATRTWTVDVTAPDAQISAGPDQGSWSQANYATFTFASTDNFPGPMEFAWSLGEAPLTPFSTETSATLVNIIEGFHTLNVVARDPAGNVDPTPATRSWYVDLTPPSVSIVSGPAEGEEVPFADVTFTLAGTDNMTPLASLEYAYVLDGDTLSAFSTSTTVQLDDLSDGPHTIWVFARDLAGHLAGGDFRSFTVLAPPVISIVSGPTLAVPSASADVTFTWTATSSSTPTEQIEYSYALDNAPPAAFALGTTATFPGLTEGEHLLVLQARDQFNNIGTLTHDFAVDLTPPDVQIVQGLPDGGWTSAAAVFFLLQGLDNYSPVQFSWFFDNDPPSAFVSTTQAASGNLLEGPHTFSVVARDQAGNLDPTPATRSFTVDRTEPETQITQGPQDGETVGTGAVTFAWQGTDDRVTPAQLRFSQIVDNGIPSTPSPATTATITYSTDGPRTFAVRAVDLAGNDDDSPATRSFTVDAEGPDITITGGPTLGECIPQDFTTFTWEATDVITPQQDLVYAYRLDGSPLSPFGPATQADLTSLAQGPHVFEIHARDLFGHVSIASRTFSVDLDPPTMLSTTSRVEDNNGVRFFALASDNTGVVSFHIQVDDATDFATPLAEADLGVGGEYLHAGSPGNTYYARALARDCAGHESPYGAISNGATIADLPDLVASNVQAPPTAFSGQTIQFSWTVTNNGPGGTSSPEWFDDVYLSPTPTFNPGTATLLGRFPNLTYLAPGESYANTKTATLPRGAAGDFHILVCTDNLNAMAETDGGNNCAASPVVEIILSAHADLTVPTVAPAPTAFSGEVIAVQWTVQNNGTGRTDVDTWYDTIFLSPDPILDFTIGPGTIRVFDTWLGTFAHTGALEATESYGALANVTLPQDIFGTYYVFVLADLHATTNQQFVPLSGNVFENVSELNISSVGTIEITLHPPANLRLVLDEFSMPQITVSPAAASSMPITVTYDVINGGFSPTQATSWTDRVYLSTDNVLNLGTDVLLGAFTRNGGLDLSATYQGSVTGTVPAGTSGPRYVLVQLDATGHELETDETDNVAAAGPVAVTLSPWADLTVTGGVVPTTGKVLGSTPVSWTVSNSGPAGTSGRPWTDEIWISGQSTWNPGAAQRLTGVGNPHRLEPGAFYSRNTSVQIPLAHTGTRYVYAVADAGNAEFENTEEGNNVTMIGAIEVEAYPPVDLQVSLTNPLPPASAGSGQSISVSWSVQNGGQGTTLTGSWTDYVYLSSDPAPGNDIHLDTFSHTGTLVSGASYTRTATVSLPDGISGAFYLLVLSDPEGKTGDGNLANNTIASAVINVSLTPSANLTVSGLSTTPAGTLIAGQPAGLEWTVHNIGGGPTPSNSWTTRCYLSLDPILDGADTRLGETTRLAPLGAGAQYQETTSLTIPPYANGAYFLIVAVDSRNDVYEAGAESDNTARIAVLSALAPPADLTVTSVGMPTAAVPGDQVTVNWTLHNNGLNPAVGLMQNIVYMSQDQAFQVQDPVLDVETTSINIPPGGLATFSRRVSLARTLQIDALGNITGEMPGLLPGDYHAIVRVNVLRNVREQDYENNAQATSAPMEVDVTPLVLDVPTAATLSLGQSRYYRVAVPADQDLRIRITSDQGAATNELYAAFSRPPSPGDFDFTGPPTFTARPRVVVPTTQAGEYFVLLRAAGLPTDVSSENVTITAEALPYGISASTPRRVGTPGQVTTRISGAGLRSHTQFFLKLPGDNAVYATAREVVLINSTEMLARWDLTGVPLGVYDIEAVTAGNVSRLGHAMEVQPAQPLRVITSSVSPEVVRDNATASFTFRFRNEGNTDIGVLQARLLFAAQSQLIALGKDAQFRARSDLAPTLYGPLTGDSYEVGAGTGHPIKVVDLVAADVAPGDELFCTLSLRDFPGSPYSVRVLAEATETGTYLGRELNRIEDMRQAILANPALAPNLITLATDMGSFASAAVQNGLVGTGLLAQYEVDDYVTAAGGLVGGGGAIPEGPADLVADLVAGGPCAPPADVPECRVENTPIISALPACVSCIEEALPRPLRVQSEAEIPLLVSTCKGYSHSVSANLKVVAPCDPNVISGPAGYGPQRFVSVTQALSYRVDFENLAELATAPAQVVRVRVPLDPDFDLTSFRLGNLGFGTHVISMPPNRTTYSAEPFFGDLGLNVRITAGIDIVNRVAVWTLTSIDPLTGQQPVNPYVGFLPVSDPNGRGQGFVIFTIRGSSSAPSGALLHAQGEITFDTNQPLLTATLQNTIDSGRPTSSVQSGITQIEPAIVRVGWNGSDDAAGAGVGSYSLYMQTDSGPFLLQGQGLTGTTMDMALSLGHTYGFYTLASDNSGNLELPKLVADASTNLTGPPTEVDEALPAVFALYQSYPNPMHDDAAIRFDLPRATEVTLELFDIAGRRVTSIMDKKPYLPGRHRVTVRGAPLENGVYFYRFRAGSFESVRKMLVLR